MGDAAVKRRTNKNGKINRIVSLFEIPRPNKGRTLERTNSLPAGKRPSLTGKEKTQVVSNTTGRVKKIKEEIEKKADSHKTTRDKWREDKEMIMEDINRLQEKIEDVTQEIEQSDTELEIVHDQLDSEDSETVSNRLSSDTIREMCEVIPDDDDINDNNPVALDSIEWWKHKSFVQINNETEEIPKEEEEVSPKLGGRFIKNSNYYSSSHSRHNDRRRTGILHKSQGVKELAKHFEGFKEAAESGETENYRKSFICEMDKELENMRMDGFQEEFYLSFENLTLMDHEPDEDDEAFETTLVQSVEDIDEYLVSQDPEDFFGEILFSEDLEKGLYYLETYNSDGKELIMCNVQIDRQSVDLSSFDEMKAKSILTNDEKMVVLMDADSDLGSKSGTDSKRTTIYSTTSGESYEDETITLTSTIAARRETYCDNQGIVRIERVAPLVEEEGEYINSKNYYYEVQEKEEEEEDEENYYESIRLQHEILFSLPQVAKKETLQYILEEIVSTERKYVADMNKVLTEYKTFLEERCPEQVDLIFANMPQIYQTQQQFLRALESADMDVREAVQVFIDFEDLFRLYPRYFRNTPKASAAIKDLNFLVKEKQDRINDKLDLSAYLLTPLQRLGKYKLFLENIIKQLEKEQEPAGAAQIALEIVKKYMSRGNDAVAIASILHSPLHTKDYGSFITREKFLLMKPKRLEMMVFLFEGVVVFTTEDPKNMEEFVYYQSIKTNDLRIATYNDTMIHLTDYTKKKKKSSSKHTYVLDAKNAKLKTLWKQQIEDILWKQMQKIKENTLKEYQSGNKTPRRPARSRDKRSKSTGSSVFYVE